MFAKADERAAVRAIADAAGVAFGGLFLTAPLDTRLSRIGARVNDASDANAQVARQQESYDLGGLDWARIDSSGPVEQTLARAQRAVTPMAAVTSSGSGRTGSRRG